MEYRKVVTSNLVAIGLCLVAAVITHSIEPSNATPVFDLFHAAVILSAWYGGLIPALVAAVVSFFVLNYFFIPPLYVIALDKTEHIRLFAFIVVAILTGLLSGRLRRATHLLKRNLSELEKAKADLQTAHDELEVRIRERTLELSLANESLNHQMDQRAEAEQAIMEISNREQRRLGQNIHDGLSQSIAGMKLMVERIRKQLLDRGVPEAASVEIIEKRLGESLAHADTISRGLYPVELDSNGLTAALEELAERLDTVHPVDCRFHASQDLFLNDNAVANHVYRIAQEAIANAVKGGRATRINLRLRARGGGLRLSVADNGVGLGNGPMRKGMGLKLMEYRARVIKGALALRSRPRGGTLVTCDFPVPGGPQPNA